MRVVSSHTFHSIKASTGEPTERSLMRSPSADSPSRPTGVSSDTESREKKERLGPVGGSLGSLKSAGLSSTPSVSEMRQPKHRDRKLCLH
jgi:hypothetical protein